MSLTFITLLDETHIVLDQRRPIKTPSDNIVCRRLPVYVTTDDISSYDVF